VYGPDRDPAFGSGSRPRFDDWLRWTGIHNITEIHFQPNLATDPDAVHAAAQLAGRVFGSPTIAPLAAG